ncbi:MAG: hypothetical protein AAGE80_18815 [Pseudomonadota bacterium]
MEEPASHGLEQFASAGIDFAVSTLILAVLAASLTQSLYDLGLRRILHRLWVVQWVRRRIQDNADPSGAKDTAAGRATQLMEAWRKGTKQGRFYALPYQQLCGQISSFLQFELDDPQNWLLMQVMVRDATLEAMRQGDDDQARQRVHAEAEDALDDLQTMLATKSRLAYYLLCLNFSFAVVAILTFGGNQFVDIEQSGWTVIMIGVTAGLMGPIFRSLIERMLSSQ